jgi:hypothetical protein
MTEPDEALLAFRDWAPKWNPTLADAFAAGHFDTSASGVCFSEGYRAGQAASAERIKALVGLLRDTTVSLIGAHSLLKNGGKNAMPSDKMFFILLEDFEKDIERARTLLKEADQ